MAKLETLRAVEKDLREEYLALGKKQLDLRNQEAFIGERMGLVRSANITYNALENVRSEIKDTIALMSAE